MFCLVRIPALRSFSRSFSTTSSRASDLSKLVLIGNLVRDPESRFTKNEKEFVSYTVAVRNPSPPPDANGERRPPTSTFHRILSFSENSNKYLRTLKKGSRVYVESAFELREPEQGADPSTAQGQRQIFLRHESIRVVSPPKIDREVEIDRSSEIGEKHF